MSQRLTGNSINSCATPGISSMKSGASARSGSGSAVMELSLSREDAAFRDEVRAFIAENYPHEMRVPNPETDLTKGQMLLWHHILHKKGWIAPLWPKEYCAAPPAHTTPR